MLDIFSLWVKACEENGTRMYCLEGSGDTGLYKLSKQYEYKNNFYNDVDTFHVWVHGVNILSTRSYTEAYKCWERNKEA